MKPLWKSRTAWLGVMVALIPALEQVQAVELPGSVMYLVGALIIRLRMATSDAVALKADKPKQTTVVLLVLLCGLLCGCSTVRYTVSEGETVDCRIKPSAPFHVLCSVEGEEVFTMRGSEALPLRCEDIDASE